ncbi:hypothetical protein COOONC_05447 [Cooperia oncophora]
MVLLMVLSLCGAESRTEKLEEPLELSDTVAVAVDSSNSHVAAGDDFVESSDAKENVTILAETGVLEEKSVEEPAPKRRRNYTNTEEELGVFSTKDTTSP